MAATMAAMEFLDEWSTPLVVVAIVLLVVMVAAAAYYLVRLLRMFRVVHNRLMPLGGKVAFWATLLYLVSPIDVLPDPMLIDDVALLAGAVTYITRLARGRGLTGEGVGDVDTIIEPGLPNPDETA